MIEINKILPNASKSIVDARLLEDVKRYVDDKTGEVRHDLSIDVLNCPACKDSVRTPVFKKLGFSYSACDNCGLVYVVRRLNDKEIDYLYSDNGRSVLQMKEVYIPTYEYRMENIYRRKANVLAMKKPGGSILDVGCSAGFFLKAAEEAGMDPYGIETNNFSLKWSREKMGLKHVYSQGLESKELVGMQFDYITMWDVFEHVSNPVGLLMAIKPFLKDDGIVIIETSHIDCFEYDYLGVSNTNILGDVHLTHFTKKSLKIISDTCGFVINDQRIFGLDVEHVINFEKQQNDHEINMPVKMTEILQKNIDKSDYGCYIRVELKKNDSAYL
jgi:2-polyprenyl-3-methyl-5-hydroxy-6-metoxy-1,4-benzoquinol methylase